jgi:ribosomal protein L7/L12
MAGSLESFGPVAFGLLGLLLLAGVGRRIDNLQGRIKSLSRIEAKLDLLLAQAAIKFDAYANVPAEVVDALRQNEKILAIKLYRKSSGAGLKEAKEFIEGIQRQS